jgi:coenzyme F420-reducing hydrogenase alpha subunit
MPDGKKQRWPIAEYKTCTNEYVVPQSTAKYTKNKMGSYMAGALARFNNNYDLLHPEAKKRAEAVKFRPLCFNPSMNSVAQLVEVVHGVKDSIRLLDEVLAAGYKPEDLVKPKKFGRGQGSVEVPRGILFHEYEYDGNGMCTGGNCIIPTNQNHGNIQLDLEALVPKLLAAKTDEKAIELGLEMLVRAYDPCISCSTHYLKVDFKR